ncbi:MAG: L-ribulose-5-phosphate 4-epimerase [Marinilabiliales bacterium]|nr:L-ribulose-5-phosphate 4-epimerase [Marinilabiliales bacterium]
MLFRELKESVFEANLELVRKGLVIYTWGNVSGIDRDKGVIAIKPSGVPYETMRWEDMVLVDLEGKPVEPGKKPSSDLPTHLEIYRHFGKTGGVVHTHSEWATAWSQTGMSLPPLGTTHADYFYGEIPCTRRLTEAEVNENYEKATGLVIVETFRRLALEPAEIPAVFVDGHGPFSWGKDPDEAVHHAVVLEQIAKMAHHDFTLNKIRPIEQFLLDKHYLRKHGNNAYYGQTSASEKKA